MNRPVTSMLPSNYAPGRRLITSDPSKLTYFARAQAVRAGTYHTWGALEGLGSLGIDTSGDYPGYQGASGSTNSVTPADSSTTKAATTFQTVGDFFGNVGRSLLGAQAAPPMAAYHAPPPSPLPMILAGVGAVGLVGFVIWKVSKR